MLSTQLPRVPVAHVSYYGIFWRQVVRTPPSHESIVRTNRPKRHEISIINVCYLRGRRHGHQSHSAQMPSSRLPQTTLQEKKCSLIKPPLVFAQVG